MRIAVDATCWPNRRGYGRFTRELITAVLELDQRNQYVLLVDHESSEFPLPQKAETCRVASSVPTIEAAGANSSRSIKDLWAFRSAAADLKAEVILFPTVYSYVPLFTSVPQLVVIHDAIPEMFPDLVFPTLRSRILWSVKRRLAVRQARLILTVSDHSRRKLVAKLGIASDRIRIVGEAADAIFRPIETDVAGEASSQWGVPRDAKCLAYVGGFSPHKNLLMLLEVVGELIRSGVVPEMYLVLVGDYQRDVFNSCYAQLEERARMDGLQDRVIFTGHLEDKDLLVLLNRAEALVLPSFLEGFGLPGLEAAACGTPVIATTESPLPGLLGDGVLAVDPHDRAGWRQAIERVLSDPALRARMNVAGQAAAGRMSWSHAARQLLAVFDELEGEYGAPA